MRVYAWCRQWRTLRCKCVLCTSSLIIIVFLCIMLIQMRYCAHSAVLIRTRTRTHTFHQCHWIEIEENINEGTIAFHILKSLLVVNIFVRCLMKHTQALLFAPKSYKSIEAFCFFSLINTV